MFWDMDMAQRNNLKIKDIVNEFGCMWYFLGKNHNSPRCFLSHSNLMQYLYWSRQMIAWCCWDQLGQSWTPVFTRCVVHHIRDYLKGIVRMVRYNQMGRSAKFSGSAKSYYDVINKTLWAVNFIVSNHPIC